MFEYNICNVFDEEIFNKQCKALEKHIPNLVKLDLLVDVDGSKIQRYKYSNDEIIVYNSYDIDAVYIKSQVALEPFFKN